MSGTITHGVVDGVQALHAPGRGGRYRAGLLFRVGRADETLSTAGITHLVEHLALHEQGIGQAHYNGMTADLHTHFHVEGSAGDVVDYLTSVCAQLRALPVHRLEVEKEILRTEQAGRSGFVGSQLAQFRHGAQGFGLSSYHELGLPGLSGDRVLEWSRTFFTRENAVLWVVGPDVPPGIRLDLPAGRRQPAPAVTSVLPRTPAWFHGGGDALVLHSLVPRSSAARVFAMLLGKAMFTDLRQRGGYSYTAQADYQPLDRDLAAVVAVADSAPDKREAVVGAFVDVLARLRLATVADEELASAKSSLHERVADAEEADFVPAHALELLLGRPLMSREEMLAELSGVGPEDIRTVAEQVHDSALVQTPAGGLDWAGLAPAPVWSDAAVRGEAYPPLTVDHGTLVVGDGGVSIVVGENASTVRYAECAVLQRYPDGAVRLIGRDGFTVPVEPTMHRLPPGVVDSMVAAVDPAVVVPMPARPPAHVPTPSAVSAPPGRRAHAAASPRGPQRWRRVAAVLLGIVTTFWLFGTVGMSVQAGQGDPSIGTSVVVTAWIMLAAGAVATWALWPRDT